MTIVYCENAKCIYNLKNFEPEVDKGRCVKYAITIDDEGCHDTEIDWEEKDNDSK